MRAPDRPRVIRSPGAPSDSGPPAPVRSPDLDPPDDDWGPPARTPAPPSPPPRRDPAGFRQSHQRSVLEVVGVVVGFGLALFGLFHLAAWLALKALPWIPLSLDQQIGEVAYDRVASADDLCTDPGPQAYVEALAAPLVAAAKSELSFQFRVLDDDTPNAFALPGGYVAVHFGLLAKADTGAEVAAVLAHELAHATERHGVGRILRKVSGYAAIGMVLGWVDLGGLGVAAVDLIDSSYDRDQERAADRVGRDTLRAAQIDPHAMGAFFDKLAKEEGPGFLRLASTHPPSAERAADARAVPPLEGPARELASPKGLRCHPEESKR